MTEVRTPKVHSVRFEDLKKRAKLHLRDQAFAHPDANAESAFAILVSLALGPFMASDRPALRAFAQAFMLTGGGEDFASSSAEAVRALARQACTQAFEHNTREQALLVMRAKQEALLIIGHWDVRSVATLINLVPAIVRPGCAGRRIECHMDGADESGWRIDFVDQLPIPSFAKSSLFQPLQA